MSKSKEEVAKSKKKNTAFQVLITANVLATVVFAEVEQPRYDSNNEVITSNKVATFSVDLEDQATGQTFMTINSLCLLDKTEMRSKRKRVEIGSLYLGSNYYNRIYSVTFAPKSGGPEQDVYREEIANSFAVAVTNFLKAQAENIKETREVRQSENAPLAGIREVAKSMQGYRDEDRRETRDHDRNDS